VLCDITRLKATIEENLPKGIVPEDVARRSTYFLHTLYVFQTEILLQQKDWDGVMKVVGVSSSYRASSARILRNIFS
jgi:hypothetical protein